MGAYITDAEVQQRLRNDFPALYDLPSQQADLTADIAAAEAIVNSYLGRRYTIPVTNSTALTAVKPLCMALLEEIGHRRGIGAEIPEKVKDAAEVARKQLEAIAAGTMTLAGADAATSPAGTSESVAVVEGNPPEFNRDNMEGY